MNHISRQPGGVFSLKPPGSFLLLFLSLTVLHMYGNAQTSLAVQYGRLSATDAHPNAGATQNLVGLRWGNLVDDNFEVGILHSSAGWFFDTESSLSEHFAVGSGSIDGLVVVGVPFGMMGDPFWISGVDVTFGPGLIYHQPVGPVVLEIRGEALTNFMSGVVGLAGGVTETNIKTGDTQAVAGRPFMLLLRLGGGVSFPLGNSYALGVNVSHLDFRFWKMTSAVLTVTF